MKMLKRGAALAAVAFAIAGGATAAQAQEDAGKLQVKVMATLVAPDGKVKSATGVPAGVNTRANDNYVPTLAVEYFVAPTVSVETICCFTAHHVSATGGATGRLADDLLILPATLTLKYHLPLGAIKPYVGAGPSVFFFLKDKVGTTGKALGLTEVNVKDKFGFALQGGVDVPLNGAMSLTIDAKRYFMRPTAHFDAGTTKDAVVAKVKLDPWVVSAGVAMRF